MSSLKKIHWVASPLGLDGQKKTTSKSKSKRPSILTRYSSAAAHNHVRPVNKFFHWGLEVDGICYEMAKKPGKEFDATDVATLGTDLCEPRPFPADEWRSARTSVGIEPMWKQVGVTRKTGKEIEAESEHRHLSLLLLAEMR